MKVRIAAWSTTRRSKVVESFLQRPAFDPRATEIAREIIADVRNRGEAAVMAACAKFDGVSLRSTELRVTDAEIEAACGQVPEETRSRIGEAHRRVAEFARRSMRRDWSMPTPHGGVLGEFYNPYERVGVYVPGGTAPLASTVIMTATLAQVAGVKDIVACTPCNKERQVNPVMLYAMKLAGCTEIYRVGGIQAIALMAYGIKHVTPVQKIVGPGGAFVTAAKRLVYGAVALDLVAGPSEIAVLADASANPAWVAADMLSQAEHGTGHEKALLVTDSADFADAVQKELSAQAAKLPRRPLVAKVAEAGGLLIATVPNMDEGVELVNQFAPEHFEILCANAEKYRGKVRCAGAVFVGPWTPEPAGDFVAGPSHVLPTGGAARLFSGLTVDDFLRRTSLVQYTKDDLQEALPVITAFGDMEGLAAHARSATIRFEGQPS